MIFFFYGIGTTSVEEKIFIILLLNVVHEVLVLCCVYHCVLSCFGASSMEKSTVLVFYPWMRRPIRNLDNLLSYLDI